MKITESSDWRDSLPFETPRPLADVVPGDPARCVGCGPQTPLHSRDRLWAVKHRHPNQHAGFVRFYCDLHVPKDAPTPLPASTAGRIPGSPRSRTPQTAARRTPSRPSLARPTPPADRPRAVCPNCWIEVPSTGVCGGCGTAVA